MVLAWLPATPFCPHDPHADDLPHPSSRPAPAHPISTPWPPAYPCIQSSVHDAPWASSPRQHRTQHPAHALMHHPSSHTTPIAFPLLPTYHHRPRQPPHALPSVQHHEGPQHSSPDRTQPLHRHRSTHRYVRAVRSPIEDGMLPLSWLLERILPEVPLSSHPCSCTLPATHGSRMAACHTLLPSPSPMPMISRIPAAVLPMPAPSKRHRPPSLPLHTIICA